MTYPSLVHIVGARPQFVKMAVVLDAAEASPRPLIIHTGQHYDRQMSQVFFDELSIPQPHHHLGAGGGTHGEQTAAMMIGIEGVLAPLSPGVAVVYGDTNSTLAATLVAAKLGWQVVHVEAGLRSFDRAMPEELNRIAVDHISTHLLCPTQQAVKQLQAEGLGARAIFTGDVMFDASISALQKSMSKPIGSFLSGRSEHQPEALQSVSAEVLKSGQYAMATLHRAANTDSPQRLRRILAALSRLPWPVLLPLHPRTRNAMKRDGLTAEGRLVLLEPVGYLDFAALVAHSHHVLTDSGGVQKEAIFHGRQCTTMRDTTEWPETLENQWNVLVDADPDAIQSAAVRSQSKSAPPIDAFGNGQAGRAVNKVIRDAMHIV